MELIPPHTNIDFVGKSRICGWISGTLVALSILGWFLFGFAKGIDFTGGTQLHVHVPASAQGNVDEGRMRTALVDAGIKDAEVTRIGTAEEREFLIRLKTSEEETQRASAGGAALNEEHEDSADSSGVATDDADGPQDESSIPPGDGTPAQAKDATAAPDAAASTAAPAGAKADAAPAAADPNAPAPEGAAAAEADNPIAGLVGAVQTALTKALGVPVEFKRIDSIGPRVGREITNSAVISVLITSVLILFYIWLRFDLVYAPGAVIALLHDVIVTAGVFIWFRLEVDQQVVAALLVVLGYSNNDTVVIYDRIRENVAMRGKTLLADVVNESVNQTLSRTVLTHGFTSIMVLALLLFGGPVLRGMSIALFVGINFGTYSSVYVASSLLVWLEKRMGARVASRAATRATSPARS